MGSNSTNKQATISNLYIRLRSIDKYLQKKTPCILNSVYCLKKISGYFSSLDQI